MFACDKYEFAARVPVDCLTDLYKLFRSGELMVNKGVALKHAGAILGETGALVHSYEHPELFTQINTPDTLEECMEQLEKLNDEDVARIKDEPVENVAFWIALAMKIAKLLLEQFS